MNSLFREDCEYETKIAESGALNWLIKNWDYIEGMFEDIESRNISNIIITSRSTIKTHDQYLEKNFEGSNLVFDRVGSYTHHSGDYFPGDAKYPFFVLPDPKTTNNMSEESSQLAALSEETRDSIFYIVLQTTRGEGRIEKYENVYWITLPRILKANGVTFEVNQIGEIAALTLFGETRSRGFMSMLWLDFRYEDISNIDNTHFVNIIRESVVSPFYLSREISKYAIFMGYYYSFKTQSPHRRNSLTKSKKSSLRDRPRITRPPSSTPVSKNKNSDTIAEILEIEIESEVEEPEIESEVESEVEEPEIENEVGNKSEVESEVEEPLLCLPSPRRAKLLSIESPKREPIRKTAKRRAPKKTGKKSSKSKKGSKSTNKKPKPGMVINPKTGRNVKINSKRFNELVQEGILEP